MVLLGFTLCFAMKAQNSSQTLQKSKTGEMRSGEKLVRKCILRVSDMFTALRLFSGLGVQPFLFYHCALFPPELQCSKATNHPQVPNRSIDFSENPSSRCTFVYRVFLFFLVFRSFCLSSLLHSFNFFLFLLPACIEQGVTAEKKKVLTYGIWEVWLFLEL